MPGCDATIEDAAGRPARRYCTAAHRSAARQARRASMQSGADDQLAVTLPWLREPDPDPRDASPAARPVETPVVPQPAGLRNRA
ncbi:MAG: hypothetical protein L0I24_16700, partial [Pseudonocardia sp.]|nr:hypothetical protein [Pseudonocardia sp.]